MNGPRKDIDPSTDLAEEDDEQTLPELEPEAAGEAAIDLAAGAGSLAVGRAAITRHATSIENATISAPPNTPSSAI